MGDDNAASSAIESAKVREGAPLSRKHATRNPLDSTRLRFNSIVAQTTRAATEGAAPPHTLAQDQLPNAATSPERSVRALVCTGALGLFISGLGVQVPHGLPHRKSVLTCENVGAQRPLLEFDDTLGCNGCCTAKPFEGVTHRCG
jgi:hypothetical protein